jgi:hypothetical protein
MSVYQEVLQMCRIGAIKSSNYVHPSLALKLMESQQKGHDNSGFAMVMHDLGGLFENYKHLKITNICRRSLWRVRMRA